MAIKRFIKKRKLQEKSQCTSTESSRPSSKFNILASLPPELFSEILSYTSTKDVLTLARVDRSLCNILVNNPRTTHIWVKARKQCTPPLPDPTPNFTEASYAAFIFDGGYCEACGTFVKNFYHSFMLRLRLCGLPRCYADWLEHKSHKTHRRGLLNNRDLLITSWLPLHEDEVKFRSDNYYPVAVYRKSHYEEASNEFTRISGQVKGVARYNFIHEKDVIKRKEMLKLCLQLRDWKMESIGLRVANRISNREWVRSVCEREAWDFNEVIHTASMHALLSRRNRLIEKINDDDFNLIRDKVKVELAAAMEIHARAKAETNFLERGVQISKVYDRLVTSKAILPTRDMFLTLPAVASLQSKSGADAASVLQEDVILSLVQENLETWVETSKSAFAALLGYPNYQQISDKIVHPTERLTALFRCTKCSVKGFKRRSANALDFRAACSHKCRAPGIAKDSSINWSVENFELDQKAISATRQYLRMLDIPEDSKASLDETVTSYNVMCLSCDGIIVMDFETMTRHSDRHEEPRFAILTSEQVASFNPNLPVVDKQLCRKFSSGAPSAKKKRKVTQFACRHCIPYESVPRPQWCPEGIEWDEGRAASKNSGKAKNRLFSFDGLVCHLKSSHGVNSSAVSNEDMHLAGRSISDSEAMPVNVCPEPE